MVEDERAAQALRWVVDLLEEVPARFQVVGGLAARAHGATRPLVDLDLYVDGRGFDPVLLLARGSVVWGPAQHRDEHWDLRFARLERHGVRIELAEADRARYFDRARGVWVDQGIDFARSEERKVLGTVVPVMPRDQLIEYKRALDRAVDRLDLEQLGSGA